MEKKVVLLILRDNSPELVFGDLKGRVPQKNEKQGLNKVLYGFIWFYFFRSPSPWGDWSIYSERLSQYSVQGLHGLTPEDAGGKAQKNKFSQLLSLE